MSEFARHYKNGKPHPYKITEFEGPNGMGIIREDGHYDIFVFNADRSGDGVYAVRDKKQRTMAALKSDFKTHGFDKAFTVVFDEFEGVYVRSN